MYLSNHTVHTVDVVIFISRFYYMKPLPMSCVMSILNISSKSLKQNINIQMKEKWTSICFEHIIMFLSSFNWTNSYDFSLCFCVRIIICTYFFNRKSIYVTNLFRKIVVNPQYVSTQFPFDKTFVNLVSWK